MSKSLPLLLAMFTLPLIAGCGGKTEGGAPSASASASAAPSPAASAAPPASATPSAAASASAAPADSAAAEGGKDPVHIHLDGARVTKGKAEGAEKSLKQHMLKLRTTCIRADAKKAGLDGTLKVTMDLGKDGKPEKVHTVVPTGKVPDDVATCVKSFYEKHVELDTNKKGATVEVTIAMGPKVQPDK